MTDVVGREYTDALSGERRHASEPGEDPLWQRIEAVRDHAIVLLDPDGNVASWHDGARAILGHEAQEIMGVHFSRFYPAEVIESGRPALHLKVASIEGRFEDEGWRVRRDGTKFWARTVLMALRDRNGELRGFGEVMRDFSELERAEALVGVASRMNEFIAMLSHELRNPLTPIRNAVHLMRHKQLDDMELQTMSAMLERHSAQLVRLVDDLLDVSRLTRGTIRVKRDVVDIASVIACALEACRPTIDGHGHTLHVILPQEPVRLTGDSVRLVQVMANLLDNAARYTPRGGEIRITVKSLAREVEIRVRDSGIGMTPTLIAKAFDLFTQGEQPIERSEGGLGVGLALARQLARLHGGDLQGHSDGRGKGSEFLVRLPLTREEDARQARSAGFDRHLGTPVDFEALREVLRSL
jgi:PAS domain S-box-containing protein